jgi:hypothetical protein
MPPIEPLPIEPLDDETPSPDDEETPAPDEEPSELITALDIVLRYSSRFDAWPKVIESIGSVKLQEIMTINGRSRGWRLNRSFGREVRAMAIDPRKPDDPRSTSDDIGAGEAGAPNQNSTGAGDTGTHANGGTILDIAHNYIDRPWKPIPVPYQTKAPVLDNWGKTGNHTRQCLSILQRRATKHRSSTRSQVEWLDRCRSRLS